MYRKIYYSILAAFYRLCCLAAKPVRKSALIIEERYGKKLSVDFARLAEALIRENYKVTVFSLGKNKDGRVRGLLRNFAMVKRMAGAEFILLAESDVAISYLEIRAETKVIQLWHGCGAYKKFGYSLHPKLRPGYYDNYDLVTVSSPEVIPCYAEAFRLPKERIAAIGISRTDVFFDREFIQEARRKTDRFLGENNKKVILYAPTFRGAVDNATQQRIFDIPALYERLAGEYIILYKAHPAISAGVSVAERYLEFFRVITDEFSISELICRCDICITDYSSLFFEFALFDRPVVFYAYDEQQYITERGLYFGFRDFVPGPVCQTEEELIDILCHIEEFDYDNLRNFREKYMKSCDGHATERIISWMKSKENL